MIRINFATLEPFRGCQQLLFIKPLLCKTIRVFEVPEVFQQTGQYQDIVQILNATATRKRANVWYYTPPDIDMLHEALWHFSETLEIENYLIEEMPKLGRDDNNRPILEILN